MTPTEYLELTARTCKQFPNGMEFGEGTADLTHAILGIAGEAGELVDGFKKHLIYGKPIDEENMKEEAGDILWYMALLLRTLGCTFEEVMQKNIDKLMIRYPDRYTDQAAIARADKLGEEK
jgi:NTP pyrophosphatase (non-canonical NTP hydrolase)